MRRPMDKCALLLCFLFISLSSFSMNLNYNQSNKTNINQSQQNLPHLNFESFYPQEWNNLSNIDFFKLLKQKNPSAQFLIDWCKAYYDLLIQPDFQQRRPEKNLSNFVLDIGNIAKNETLKSAILAYFNYNPDLLIIWAKHAELCLSHKKKEKYFNNVEIIGIFYQFSKLEISFPPHLKNAWDQEIIERIKLAKITDPQKRLRPTKEIKDLQERRKRTEITDPQMFINILYGHALLNQQLSTDLYNVWFASALYLLNSGEFSPLDLTNLIRAQRILQMPLSDDFQEAWYKHAKIYLDNNSFNAEEINIIFHSYALLREGDIFVKPWKDDLKAAFYETIINKLKAHEFNESELSTLIYSFSCLNEIPPADLKTSWDDEILALLKRKQAIGRLDGMGLTHIFYGHLTLDIPLPLKFKREFYEEALAFLRKNQFLPIALSTLFYAYAVKNEREYDVYKQGEVKDVISKNGEIFDHEFMSAWEKAVEVKLDSTDKMFDGQFLNNIFYGYALLKNQIPEQLKAKWYRAALMKLRTKNPKLQFIPQHLANILYGHALLKIDIPANFSEVWYDAATKDIASFSMQNLANIRLAHFLRHKSFPKDFKQKYQEALLSYLKDEDYSFDPQHLANIFHAEVHSGSQEILLRNMIYTKVISYFNNLAQRKDNEIFKGIASVFYDVSILDMVGEGGVKIGINEDLIEIALFVLDNTNNENQLDGIFKSLTYLNKIELVTKNKDRLAKFNRLKQYMKERHFFRVSPLETQVSSFIKEHFSSYEFNQGIWFEGIFSQVDFYSKKHNIVIQVDGPSHFFQDTEKYDYKTLATDALLKKKHPKLRIIHIPYFDWNNAQNKKSYLDNILRTNI